MDLNVSILVDTIFLLINENTEATRELANRLILLFKEAKIVDADESDSIRFYIRVLHRIISEKTDKSSMDSLGALLLKMKSEAIFASHKEHVLDLEKSILDSTVASEEKRSQLKEAVISVIKLSEYDKKLKKAFGRLQRVKDMDSLAARSELLKEYEAEFGKSDTIGDGDSDYGGPKALDSISSKDKKSLIEAFTKIHNRRTLGVIKSGQQGFNKACGKAGGLASDSSVIILAPSHNGKSIWLNSWAYWGPMYNSFPIREEDGAKPCIYIATTENGAQENYLLLYEKMYYEEHGEMPPKIKTTDGKVDLEDLEARVDAVMEFYNSRGIELLIEAYAPHEFGPINFIGRLKYLMAKGYYVAIAIFDYLMKSKLPVAAREDIAIGSAYNMVSNFTKHFGIMFATGHQYTRDGMIRLDGKIDKVKSMNEGGIKGGYDAFQSVDFVIMGILESDHKGQVYTTFRVAKHRYVTDTPPADKYFAYPIINGSTKDDFNDETSKAVKDIYTEGMDNTSGYTGKGKEEKKPTTENNDLF